MLKTALQQFNKIVNDEKIRLLYNQIHEYEDANGGWCYHDFNHVKNVANCCEQLLREFNYDEDFIYEAKIAAILHDVGCSQGKDNHPYRSYEFAKKYFKENGIALKHENLILEAIKNHSEGFDSDNILQLVLILADKLDITKKRLALAGKRQIGARQYQFINDIKIKIKDKTLLIQFNCDKQLDLNELNEDYFTPKVFKAVRAFSKQMNLKPQLFINDKIWQEFENL